MKQFYFDQGVWANIIGFVDIKPFKKDTFVNGTYSERVPFHGFNETVEIIGRTKCFVKCVVKKDGLDNGYRTKKVETRKKIFIEDGIECIKMEHLTLTAHDNERYKFSTKKEWERFHKGYHSGPPSECDSDSDYDSDPPSDYDSDSDPPSDSSVSTRDSDSDSSVSTRDSVSSVSTQDSDEE
jgi:hypothetical protein